MRLYKKVASEVDSTVKYIFTLDGNGPERGGGLKTEMSYINKEDGKIIICVSTHTGCDYKCKFCHLTTDKKLQKTRKLDWTEIATGVSYILSDMKARSKEKTLLVSYMGAGEPLINTANIIVASNEIKMTNHTFKNVRFAISTMIPFNKLQELFKLADAMKHHELKIHYSLHSTEKKTREELMPFALDHTTVLPVLKYINKIYQNIDTEIHYTPLRNKHGHIKNTEQYEWMKLANISNNTGIPVKFLKLSVKEGFEKRCVTEEDYKEYILPLFETKEAKCEYYTAPGEDIGASCGQISQGAYEVK